MATLTMDGGSEFVFVEKVRRYLTGARALSQVLEETLIDVVAAYTPWLAPVIPAAIGYSNVRSGLAFDPWLAFVYALVVEFLGLATTTTALQFRAWNKEQTPAPGAPVRLRGKRAPMGLALAMAVFYLAIVLTVNVALDAGSDLQKWVKAGASTFSIVGAVTLALRAEQAKRVAEAQAVEIKQENDQAEALQNARREAIESEQRELALKLAEEERQNKARIEAEAREYQRKVDEEERERKFRLKELKLRAQVSESAPKVTESLVKVSNFPETFKKWDDWRKVPAEQRRRIAGMKIEQVMEEYGVEERVGYLWIERAVKFVQDENVEVAG